jgi:hypothetical protein
MDRLRAWLIRQLTRLLAWLNPPPDDSALMARVKVLVANAEKMAASGEYKRHAVYARLLKEFPESRKRDLALAIERVLSGV